MKVLISDPITDSGLDILNKSGLDIIYLPESEPKEILKYSKDVHGWIIRSGTKISNDIINQCKNLQVIGRAGVGIDNIDFISATRKGVIIMNTPDVNTISAAEHTVALILSLSRNIHLGHLTLSNGKWNRNELIGSELRNKTLGIVGLGKIGREVMHRCHSFNMNLIGYDPFINQDMFPENEIKITDLDTVIDTADYITIHVPLSEKTKNLFNYKRLCKMKPEARIINVARGGIINEKDLAKVLKEERISGAAIDVFTVEPINKNHPLLGAPNILLSPHLGASTFEAKEGVSRAICEQVRDFLIDGKLTNALNLPISNMSTLNDIKPLLDLSELLGSIQSQISMGPIKKISVECQGKIDETKPIVLAFLKGLLEPIVPERINYINAETIAKELGFAVEFHYSSLESNYLNLISTKVTVNNKVIQLDGSVFDDGRPRLVNILGREMEVTPKGAMLFVENKDVPGVIGKVGTMLGDLEINIAAYLLNRSIKNDSAFAVIRVDNLLSESDLKLLLNIEEINSVQQITISKANQRI